MTLEGILRGIKDVVVDTYDHVTLMGKAGYFRLFTALMPVIGCGDTINNYYNYEGVQAKGCVDDTGCRDSERCMYNNDLEANICYGSSGVADYGSEGGSGDDDTADSCEGSPLLGKYLWVVSPLCSEIITEPFDSSCSGEMRFLSNSASYTYSGDRVTYTFTSGRESGNTYRFRITDNVTSDMVSAPSECLAPDLASGVTDEEWAEGIRRYQCYLDEGNLVALIFEGEPFCMDLLFRLSSTPFPGGAECRDYEDNVLQWRERCLERFPPL